VTSEHRLGKSMQQLHVERLEKELSHISLCINETLNLLEHNKSFSQSEARLSNATLTYLRTRQRYVNIEHTKAQIDARKHQEELLKFEERKREERRR